MLELKFANIILSAKCFQRGYKYETENEIEKKGNKSVHRRLIEPIVDQKEPIFINALYIYEAHPSSISPTLIQSSTVQWNVRVQRQLVCFHHLSPAFSEYEYTRLNRNIPFFFCFLRGLEYRGHWGKINHFFDRSAKYCYRILELKISLVDYLFFYTCIWNASYTFAYDFGIYRRIFISTSNKLCVADYNYQKWACQT